MSRGRGTAISIWCANMPRQSLRLYQRVPKLFGDLKLARGITTHCSKGLTFAVFLPA